MRRLNSEYYDDITKQIRDGVTKITDLTTKRNTLDKMIKSGNFAGQKLHELNKEFTATRVEISDERKHQLDKVKAMCSEFAEVLRQEDDIDPKDVDQVDLELLKNIDLLTDRDLKAMLDRNSDNRTMLQMILRVSKQHGRSLGIEYAGNENLIQNVSILPSIAKTILRYDTWEGGAGHVYKEVLGEGTDLANLFSPDND